MERLRIIADSREPKALRELLAAHPDVELTVQSLPVGDFIIGPDTAVERKTAEDFARSIADGRFADQAARLKDCYDRVLWIIEGNPFATRLAVSPQALTGALSFLAVVNGATLVRTENGDETASLIVAMARHLQRGSSGEVVPRHCKPEDPDRLSEFIVAGLPGVGLRRARALLAHFGSVDAVFRADTRSISALPGFGKKSAATVRAAIERPYSTAARENDPPPKFAEEIPGQGSTIPPISRVPPLDRVGGG